MLKKIEISNYKSIGYASLEFYKENIIVGPNAVGKSNLLDAIHFIRDAASDGLDHSVTKRHGINSIRRWSKTRPYNINIKMSFSDGEETGEYKLVIASGGGDFSVLEEEGSWYGQNPFRGKTTEGPIHCSFRREKENVKFDIPEGVFAQAPPMQVLDSDVIIYQFNPNSFFAQSYFFRSLYRNIINCGAYSIYPNKIREPQTISNLDFLSDDGTNLASIIRQMRNTSYRSNREALTSALRQVLPIVSEIRIESAGGFYVPVFRVKETLDGQAHDLNMSQISDGTLRMLGMLTAFYQPKAPRRITMEEPEQMVHPGLLPILVDAARDYSDIPNVDRQVFFTTHSPTLLDMFSPENIIGTRFEDGVSKFAPMSKRQIKFVKERLFTAGELLVSEGIVD